ncbi:hypothetical protein KEM60_02529 [Austwickia sp. TVS 96-490-7B]|uniref:thiol-disulfide oxidoreductase DCC family protein n=1 Tax=Austwickia sp. TVS 96-490-7B TaxID=2830843 RepID=UPI001C59C40F|nr:DCC1-like thiol-disulfide oxidoreductase family protein [Austwickia sp. TVS 96-490-7B]MBW3086316.1 hypothetical protein [Austwickia sp. TVS 96-490-7B]
MSAPQDPLGVPPRVRPVLVYDGDCGFCTSSARWAARTSGGRYDVTPWQQADLSALGLTRQECLTAVRWVDTDGTPAAGHLAIAAAMRHGDRWLAPWGMVMASRLVDPVAAAVYRWVAAHRHQLPGGDGSCALPSDQPT